MSPSRKRLIKSLFKRCMELYASRDPRMAEYFSECFTGYMVGGDFIVGDKKEWLEITRQDYAEMPGPIRIQTLDLLLRDLSDTVVLVTGIFRLHMKTPEPILTREVVRMTLVFLHEGGDWKIAHNGLSVPFSLVQKGEVYPIKVLSERNQELELLLKERTQALEVAMRQLDTINPVSYQVRTYLESCLEADPDIDTAAVTLGYSRRTLTRRLREEGTSFQQIKDHLRRSVAIQLLTTGRIPVEAIAARVGFADLTTFHRAFKKWTGTTPLAYQRSAG